MGQTIYHKLSAEVTGPDGREWLVTVEPPYFAPAEGGEIPWEATITWLQTRSEARQAQEKPTVSTFIVSTREGIFTALRLVVDTVPRT